MERIGTLDGARLGWGLAFVCSICVAAATAAQADTLDTGGGGISAQFVIHAQKSVENGHITEAIDYCNRALAMLPNFIRARFTRAQAEMAGGENDKAIDDFTQVLAAHPEYPLVHWLRGEAQLHAHRPLDAVADLNQALKTEVGTSRYMAANIFAQRSLAFEMLDQADQSLADLQLALKDVTSLDHDWSILNNHCYSAAIVGLLEMAKLSCDESVSRHTRDMAVYDSRGLMELKSGSWDSAIADYTQSLYYRPDLSLSLYGRSLAKKAKGDTAGANADMRQAVAAEPNIAAIMSRLGVQAPKT